MEIDKINKIYDYIIKKPLKSLLLLLLFSSVPIIIIFGIHKAIVFLELQATFSVFIAADLLSYFGTIISIFIGAVATFSVLYITIQVEKEERKRERRLQIYPYFRYIIIEQSCISIVDLSQNIYLTFSDNKSSKSNKENKLGFCFSFGLRVENIGIKSAINYSILEIDSFNTRDISIQGLGDIKVDENKVIEFNIYATSKKEFNNMLSKNNFINIKIAYNNITGDYYEQNIKISFTLDTLYLDGKQSDYKPVITKNSVSKAEFYSDKNINHEESKKIDSFLKKKK